MHIKVWKTLVSILIQSWRSRIGKTWIPNLAQSFTSCVALDKLINLSEPLLIYKMEQTIVPAS